ncbi:MAG: 50S ribosomal protein L1, partial [Nanoarchaeota archaeon]
MKKENFLTALKKLRENSKKRKFEQTVDLIVNLKDVDKKNSFDVYLAMPHNINKSTKICAIVDSEYEKQANTLTDKVITKDMLGKLQAKDITNLAKGYDIFIAQASLMGQTATMLGKILGPLG